MRIIWNLLEALFALAAVGIILLFCFYAFPHSAAKDPWDVGSAIGTVGAAVVALWIATRESLRRKKEEHELALVIAASVYLPIGHTVGMMEPILAWFTKAEENTFDPSEADNYFGALASLLYGVDAADVAKLAPLGNNCAINVAGGFGNLLTAQLVASRVRYQFIPQIVTQMMNNSDLLDRRCQAATSIAMSLRVSIRLLNKASVQCKDACADYIYTEKGLR